MNTSYVDMDKEECPNYIKEFVERVSTEGNNTVIGRYDLHISVKKDQDIIVEIESYNLDTVQKDELADRIEEMLFSQNTLENDDYNLKKYVNPITINFNY